MALPSHLIDIQTIYLESVVQEYLRGREILAASRTPSGSSCDSHWKIPSLHGNEGTSRTGCGSSATSWCSASRRA